jgi:cyclopropane-fatty-acyl-phospholipid synthase
MLEYYLCVSEFSFRDGGHMNFQLQLAKRVDAAPMTCDYMIDAERAWTAGAGPADKPSAALRRQ